ncbi:MAG: chromosome partitioning protein [Methanolobus sp. T82-4]|nr:MAG: chromosome partitioning protein [Methanolobus sp. T82-4]
MENILCVCNPKGGTGKTTTAISIAEAYTMGSKRVLLIDFDLLGVPSKYFSMWVAKDRSANSETTEEKPISAENEELIYTTLNEKIDIIPWHETMISDLSYPIGKHNPLKDTIIASAPAYDLIIIDTSRLSPKFEMAISKNLLITASDDLSIEGIQYLLEVWNTLDDEDRNWIQIRGILLTMVNKSSYLSKNLRAHLTHYFKDRVLETIIPRNEKIQKSIANRESIFSYDLKSPPSMAYITATKELMNKWRF